MGIDRKDVRLVCHFSLPKSLEGFYQESGRAGRDQKPARSVLYYGLDDKNTMEFVLKKEAAKNKKSKKPDPGTPENAALEAFVQMVRYCEGKGCRRQTVLAHFGEKVSLELCSRTCDTCRYPQRISQQLEELAEQSRTYSRGLSSSIVCSTQCNAGRCHTNGSEFWKNDQDGEDDESEDEISSSDDEAVEAAAAVASKQRGSLIDKKMDALLRAEEAFATRQGAQDEKHSQEKKVVTQSIRDIAIQRLENGIVQAFQRLQIEDCVVTPKTAAATLEGDSYKKYGKAGRPFYNSQVASSIRWLSSCTIQDLLNKVPITKEVESNNGYLTGQQRRIDPVCQSVGGNYSPSHQPVPDKPLTLVKELQASPKSLEEMVEPIPLPRIPSMAEFVKRTKGFDRDSRKASDRDSKKPRLRS